MPVALGTPLGSQMEPIFLEDSMKKNLTQLEEDPLSQFQFSLEVILEFSSVIPQIVAW